MHSEIFHKKACLLMLLKQFNIKEINEIKSNFLNKNDIKIFKQFGINIKKIKKKRVDSIFLLLLRTFGMNFILYLKSRKLYKEKYSKVGNKKYKRILSAWSMGNIDTYLNELNIPVINSGLDFLIKDSLIFLKPHRKNIFINKTLFKFLIFLRKKYYDYFEFYPKMNFLKLFKQMFRIYFSKIPNEIKKDLLAVFIERQYVDGLINYILKNFSNIEEYCTDAIFHTYNTYMSEKLRENNIKSIDVSKILDTASPFLSFDEAYICSKTQQQCYTAPNTVFKYKKRNPIQLNKKEIKKKKFAIFFVHQSLFSDIALTNSITIRPIYYKVVDFIERLAMELDIPIFAKYHPRSIKIDKFLSNNIKIVKDIKELPKDYNYLALTYFSNFAIELLKIMPFILINIEARMNLKYIFPNEDLIYAESYAELKSKIIVLSENENYIKYWKQLDSLMSEQGFAY